MQSKRIVAGIAGITVALGGTAATSTAAFAGDAPAPTKPAPTKTVKVTPPSKKTDPKKDAAKTDTPKTGAKTAVAQQASKGISRTGGITINKDLDRDHQFRVHHKGLFGSWDISVKHKFDWHHHDGIGHTTSIGKQGTHSSAADVKTGK